MSDKKIIGFAGYSGSGKTTLLEKLIPLLTAQGLRIAVIKHAHHNFDIDKPGKDSYRHRQAGAGEVMIINAQRWALMHELHDETEPSLEELCAKFSPCDLILAEGYKHASIPKLEVHRTETGQQSLHPSDPRIIAIVTNSKEKLPLPVLDINKPEDVAAFILNYFSFAPNGHGKNAAPDNETRHARFPDGTTSHSTRLSKNDNQMDGYLPSPLPLAGEGDEDSLRESNVNP